MCCFNFACASCINTRIYVMAAALYITNFTGHSVHTRKIKPDISSIVYHAPPRPFNDIIAQWEVNRNIFMVHLPRRILDLPAARSPVARHKNCHKKGLRR